MNPPELQQLMSKLHEAEARNDLQLTLQLALEIHKLIFSQHGRDQKQLQQQSASSDERYRLHAVRHP